MKAATISALLRARSRPLKLLLRGLRDSDQIFTETTPLEKDTLFSLARRKAGGTGVEIGSAFGASSCFIAAGLAPQGGILHCVDRWNIEYRKAADGVVNFLYRDDGMLLSYRWDEARQEIVYTEVGPANGDCPTYQLFLDNTKAFSKTIRPLRSESTTAAASFNEPIDFLFIDGWHEYDGVKRDADAWFPKVKPGGIVAFHDSGWSEGVKRVIAEDVIPRTTTHTHLPNMFWAILR